MNTRDDYGRHEPQDRGPWTDTCELELAAMARRLPRDYLGRYAIGLEYADNRGRARCVYGHPRESAPIFDARLGISIRVYD